MAKRYFYVVIGSGSCQEEKVFQEHELDKVLAIVKRQKDLPGHVDVIFGQRLEFEPAVVVQSYKVKG
jgi:hypothetical protein